MADAAVSFAVQKLGDALVNKVSFLRGVEEQAELLNEELQNMQSFLKDAAEKQGHDERVRKWISDVRELAQDADDVIEFFSLKVDAPRRNKSLPERCACFPVHVSHLHSIGKEIESINTRLGKIQNRRVNYGIGNLEDVGKESPTENIELRRRVGDQQAVGLNEETNRLVNEMIQGQRRKGLSLAAIVGMGGIGKSTLAREIYNHPDIARFEHRAWVVVSYKFDAEEIMKQIMHQLPFRGEESTRKHKDRLKEVEKVKDGVTRHVMLQEMLKQRLEGKRYFIVLDDVWQHDDWVRFKNAFPTNEQGEACTLLFTSRNKIITKHVGYVYEMKPFNEEKSRVLLLKTVSRGRSEAIEYPQGLEDIGEKILKNCHGLPLAIVLAGGLLAYEGNSKTGWEGVLKQVKNYYSDSSEIGASILAVLELSYHNLPSQLKPCFLCLAFFKENEVIPVTRLVHIWVALGLVQGGKKNGREKAKGHLDELIKRNLIQIKSLNIKDGVKYCHVHDLLRELSIKKAKEEIGLELLINENEGSSSSSKPRHRVVRGKEFIISSNKNKHLRSLFLHVENPNDAYFKTPSNWKGFELLMILDIECSSFKELPLNIRASIGIRILRLREKMSVLILPSWLDDLKNLEILDVGSAKVVVFPDVSWKMNNLRHFYINSDCRKFSDAMNKSSWENLETLKCMRPENVLQGFNCHLRKLCVGKMDKGGEAEVWRFLKESQVEVLRLRWEYEEREEELLIPNFPDRLTKLKLVGPLSGFSSVDKLSQNIAHLTLSDTYITRNDLMQELGKLPKLMVLKLDAALHQKYLKIEVLPEGFPSLRVLHLMRMFELIRIEIKGDGMPQLQRVEIYQCPRFQTENLRNHSRTLEVITKDDYF